MVGTTISHYKITGKLGSGQMSEDWKAKGAYPKLAVSLWKSANQS